MSSKTHVEADFKNSSISPKGINEFSIFCDVLRTWVHLIESYMLVLRVLSRMLETHGLFASGMAVWRFLLQDLLILDTLRSLTWTCLPPSRSLELLAAI